jgi:hypothetical protein
MDKYIEQEPSAQVRPRNRGSSALDIARHPAPADEAVLLGPSRVSESDEVLIVDGRANLGPAQLVENKLSNLLRSSPLPVSHVRLTALCGGRRSC